MIRPLIVLAFAVAAYLSQLHAQQDDANITWLAQYDGKSVPAASAWKSQGEPTARLDGTVLNLADTSPETFGSFRAGFKTPEPGTEIVVDVTLKVNKTTGALAAKPESKSLWPWRDGAPVSVLVSDGAHQEGLVFYVDRVTTWTDRSFVVDSAGAPHTYRLVIRGTDMSIAVDGAVKVKGQGAFWKPTETPEAFIQFGSTSKRAQGEAEWQSVRVGVRKATGPTVVAPVKITVSEPWPITRAELKPKHTRPYVYNIGHGRLLLSVAQGPDAIYEPYGVMTSDDAGKTWNIVKDWDQTESAPLPMLRTKDGSILGMSRWTWPQPDGSLVASTVRWDAPMSNFTTYQSRIHLPPEYQTIKVPFTCERQAFEEADGAVFMAGYTKTGPDTPEGRLCGKRYGHLLRSTDAGKTWNHFAVMGPGGEPAVAKTGNGRMTAILRTGPFKPLAQTFSEDNGKTWSGPTYLEVGSVCPDLVMMSNGLLACSYGRPASCLMFSPDGGRTWTSHHVISDKTGFNYSGIVEVSPGRLLYLHDGGGLQALYIDVERASP